MCEPNPPTWSTWSAISNLEEAGPALHPAPKGAALAARRGKPRSAAPCVELEWQDAYVSTSLESRRSG